jgi:TRAP-type C4-dicarboxylate transport system substrate-binding protein
LQRGIVDAVITGISAVGERKLYEVTKYLSYPNLTIMVFCVLINEKKWDSLPSDIQKIMLESAKEAEIDTFNEAQKTDKESLVFLKEKGMDIYDPPEQQKARWKEACKQIFDIPAERAGETGRVLMEIARKLR